MIQFSHYDIDIGARLVEALAHLARTMPGMPITHADLLTLARSLHPKDAMLGRAVPVGIGPKLGFVEAFCTAHGYPNLASLANGSGREPERRAVAAADWSGVDAQLPAYVAAAHAALPARFKPRKERPADVAWYAYFCSHRAACENLTGEDKQEIINQLMGGLDPESALKRIPAVKPGAA